MEDLEREIEIEKKEEKEKSNKTIENNDIEENEFNEEILCINDDIYSSYNNEDSNSIKCQKIIKIIST